MKRGEFVVMVIQGPRLRTATIKRVSKVTSKAVALKNSSLLFDPTSLSEIDPPIPGFRSYLVQFDDGEVDAWHLDDRT